MCTIYFYNLKGDKEGINFVKKKLGWCNASRCCVAASKFTTYYDIQALMKLGAATLISGINLTRKNADKKRTLRLMLRI